MPERARFDIVVVGAGPAGIAAACAAAEHGKSVGIIDESPWLGGQIWRGAESKARPRAAMRWINRLRASGATIFSETAVVAAPFARALRCERRGVALDIDWQSLVLAVGARELFLPFPGWTLPNVFGVGGLQALAKAGWPVAGKRVVIAGTGPLLLAVADGLRGMDANVLAIAEQAPWNNVRGFATQLLTRPSKVAQAIALKARLLGVPYQCGVWPVRANGVGAVESVTLSDGKRTWTLECDALACAFGLVPNVELPLLLGCALDGMFVRADRFQETSVPSIYCAGEPTGIGGWECAIVEGTIAGLSASDKRGAASDLFSKRALHHRFRDLLRDAFALGDSVTSRADPDTMVCRCEDVPFAAIANCASWREAKLHTRCGMGACQGRVCGAATRVLFGWGMESVRPPVLPSRVETLSDLDDRSDETPTEGKR